MQNFKDTRLSSKAILATLLVMILTFVMPTAAFASETPDNTNGNIISHSETWVTPYKHAEVTVYDLGDGFTSTETITEEYESCLLRASGTKTKSSTVEIKNGSAVAATITVKGSFSYNGSNATVTSASHSRSVKSGYTEDSWSTNKRDSSTLYGDAMVSAMLTVKNNSSGKTYVGNAMVTCGKNG
jgi:hypothetical protein